MFCGYWVKEGLLYMSCEAFEPSHDMTGSIPEWDHESLEDAVEQLVELTHESRATEMLIDWLYSMDPDCLCTWFRPMVEALAEHPWLRQMVRFVARETLGLELGYRVNDQYKKAFDALEKKDFLILSQVWVRLGITF